MPWDKASVHREKLADSRAETSTSAPREALLTHQHLVAGELIAQAAPSDGDSTEVGIAASLRSDVRARAAAEEGEAPDALSAASLGSTPLSPRARVHARGCEPGPERCWSGDLGAAELELMGRMDAAERGTQARLAYSVALAQPLDAGFDASWIQTLGDAPVDLWLARRSASIAQRLNGEAAAGSAALRIAELVAGPNERASLAANVEFAGTPTSAQSETIRAFHVAAAEHSLLAEHLAELERRAGSHAESAAAYERAARASHTPARRARLFVAAAEAHEEHGDDTRSVGALEEASQRASRIQGSSRSFARSSST